MGARKRTAAPLARTGQHDGHGQPDGVAAACVPILAVTRTLPRWLDENKKEGRDPRDAYDVLEPILREKYVKGEGFEWLEDLKHTASIIRNRSKAEAKPQTSLGS